MYQMICPVLERLQAMEGGDASNGAGTGTEIDEVRGGLRALPSGWLEPGGGGGGSGWSRSAPSGAGATATRRREPTVSTTAAWAGSRRGARRWTRWRGCWSCSTPATGTSRPSTSTRSWWPITASSAATTGCGFGAWSGDGVIAHSPVGYRILIVFGFAARIERLSASICMAISVCWDWNVRALSLPPLSLLTRAMAVSPSALNP